MSVIDTSTNSQATGLPKDRHTSWGPNSIIVVIYQENNALRGKMSDDLGATWTDLEGSPGSTLVASVNTEEYSLWRDGYNDIFVVYEDSGSIKIVKLKYGGDKWSAGTPVTVQTGTTSHYPSVIKDNNNRLWVVYTRFDATAYNYRVEIKYSDDNGDSWSGATIIDSPSWYGGYRMPALLKRYGRPAVLWLKDRTDVSNNDYQLNLKFLQSNGSWSSIYSSSEAAPSYMSAVVKTNQTILVCLSGSYIRTKTFLSIADGWESDQVLQASDDTSGDTDIAAITTDGRRVCAAWVKKEGSNNYQIRYRQYDGRKWDESTNIAINNGRNNRHLSAPEVKAQVQNVPVFWTEGTASPYNVNFAYSFCGCAEEEEEEPEFGGRFLDFYVDILDDDEMIVESNMKIRYGAVYVADRKIRRTCTLDFVRPIPQDWQKRRFKVYYGRGHTRDTIVYKPIGVFLPRNPKEIDRGVEILTTFQGNDKTQLLLDSVLKEPLTFYEGEPLENCVELALSIAGIPSTQQNLEDTGFDLNWDITFETGSDCNHIIDVLVHSFDADWYFDGDGIFNLIRLPDPPTRSVLAELLTNDESIILNKETEYDNENYYNSVVVVGGMVEQDPIIAYRKDVTEISRIGREITRSEVRADLTDQDQVNNYAERILVNGVKNPRKLTLENLVLIEIEPKFLIKIDNVRYRIQEFNIPLNLQTQTLVTDEVL